MISIKDVIVIGLGPGGSSLAKKCAELGLDVIGYEKRQEIGSPKRCGEGLSASSAKRLNLEIPSYCKMQKVKGAKIYVPNGESVEAKYDKTGGWILERKMFDKYLAKEASKAGAHLQAKSKVEDLIFENGKIKGVKGKFLGKPFKTKGKVVVSCEGVEALIARKAGLKTQKNPKLMDSGFQYEMGGIELEKPNYIELYFGNEIAERGYVWIFPKGNHTANIGVGIGADCEKSAKYYLDKFIQEREDLKKGSILEVNSGGIPVGGFMKNMVKDNFLVVGDSANQVNPIHGGGIPEAIQAGRIAGEVIVKALEEGDTSEERLKEYNKRWWETRGKKLKKIEKIREILEELSDDDLNFLAENLKGEDLVGFSKGKRLEILGKVLLKRPRLIKLGRKLI